MVHSSAIRMNGSCESISSKSSPPNPELMEDTDFMENDFLNTSDRQYGTKDFRDDDLMNGYIPWKFINLRHLHGDKLRNLVLAIIDPSYYLDNRVRARLAMNLAYSLMMIPRKNIYLFDCIEKDNFWERGHPWISENTFGEDSCILEKDYDTIIKLRDAIKSYPVEVQNDYDVGYFSDLSVHQQHQLVGAWSYSFLRCKNRSKERVQYFPFKRTFSSVYGFYPPSMPDFPSHLYRWVRFERVATKLIFESLLLLDTIGPDLVDAARLALDSFSLKEILNYGLPSYRGLISLCKASNCRPDQVLKLLQLGPFGESVTNLERFMIKYVMKPEEYEDLSDDIKEKVGKQVQSKYWRVCRLDGGKHLQYLSNRRNASFIRALRLLQDEFEEERKKSDSTRMDPKPFENEKSWIYFFAEEMKLMSMDPKPEEDFYETFSLTPKSTSNLISTVNGA